MSVKEFVIPVDKTGWKVADGSGMVRFTWDYDNGREKLLDIITSGRIRTVPASPQEIADQDRVELPRISLLFNRRSYGRLRLLIDRISAR